MKFLAIYGILILTSIVPNDKKAHNPIAVNSYEIPRDGEPTCDELRNMWTNTKRELFSSIRYKQRPLPIPPELYRSEPAFAYGTWKQAQARPRSMMATRYSKPIYGRVVHSPDKFIYRHGIPASLRSFAQIARIIRPSYPMYSPPDISSQKSFFRLDYPRRPVLPVKVSHVGRFQELQNVLRNERAQEEILKINAGAGNVVEDQSKLRYDVYRSAEGGDYPRMRSSDGSILEHQNARVMTSGILKNNKSSQYNKQPGNTDDEKKISGMERKEEIEQAEQAESFTTTVR